MTANAFHIVLKRIVLTTANVFEVLHIVCLSNTIDIEASLHRTPSLQIELASSEVFYYRMCHSKAENGQFNTPYIIGIAKMCFCYVWFVNGFCVLNYLDSR